MDVSILTKRYSSPGTAKVIGTLLFPLVFILMLVLPVFEMIPEAEYLNVFNNQGVPSGGYSSTQYTMFNMMNNDYHSGAWAAWFIVFGVLSVLCGIAFLLMNRAKLAAIPASIILAEVIFSVFRSPAKLYTGVEYCKAISKATTDGADGFVLRYQNGDAFEIFRTLGQYWVLWCAAIVLLAFVIYTIVVTKTLIEKKK